MKPIIHKCSLFLFGAALLIMSACDTPLSLGSMVNTSVPVIKNTGEIGPGSILRSGPNTIKLDVQQDFGVDSVTMTIWYIDLNGNSQERTIPAYLDNSGVYVVDIDTSDMADGSITAQVTAVDATGNSTTTTDMIYIVKNSPPQIEMTIPAIKGGTMRKNGYPSGQIPDFDDPFLNVQLERDPVYVGFDLMGLGSDNLGIEQGYPKIMIWPAPNDPDDHSIPTDARYGTWRSMVKPNDIAGLKATKFSWPMVELIADPSAEGGYRLPGNGEPYTMLAPKNYRFRILTRDLYGRENIYPNRSDNSAGPGGQTMNPNDYPAGNRYMEISYIAAEVPIISFRAIPQYYNGVGNFVVDFIVSSQNALDTVGAFITNTDDGSGSSSKVYVPSLVGAVGSTYTYRLTITPAELATWPSVTDGNLYVSLTARDSLGKPSPAAYRNFIYDRESPRVEFQRPVVLTNLKAQGNLNDGSYAIYYPSSPPKWVTGQITVGGLADDTFGLHKVYYHIGKLGDDANMSDAQRETIYNNAAWKDTQLDTFSPAAGWSGSLYAWTYTYDFNGFKSQTGLVQEETEIGRSQSEADFKTTGETRFYLPFYVKAVDKAGNQQIVHYKLCIDPDLDIPQVDINYPDEEWKLVGGEVRLSGVASDNNWVHTVLIRIKKDGVPGYYIPQTTSAFYPANPGFPAPAGGDTNGWFKANKIGDDMVVGWFYNINTEGGLNPTIGDEVNVRIEVLAVDTKVPSHQVPDLVGPPTVLNVKFSSGVPTIKTPKIVKAGVPTRDYFEGIRASGNFSVSIIVDDDQGITSVRARFNGAPYTDLINSDGTVKPGLPAGWSIGPLVTNGLRVQRTLTFDINPDGTNPLYPTYGATGLLSLDVQVSDNNTPSFTSNASYNIGIDNFYPNAVISTPSVASGDKFLILGTAKDYGTSSVSVQGLERMLVYFEKAQIDYANPATHSGTRTVTGTGQYLKPDGTAMTFLPTDVYPNVRDMTLSNPNSYGGPNGPNTASFANFPRLEQRPDGVWTSPHAMVIDYPENDPEADYDGDGTFGEMWNGLVDKEWGARFNTTKFSDGPLMVHYIIMDQAGNATHYRKDIYIENRKPQIRFINLGTDKDYDGVVTPWSPSNPGEFRQNNYEVNLTSEGGEKIYFTYPAPFRIRNNRFGLRIETVGGNGTIYCTVTHVTPHPSNGAPPTIAAPDMKRGNVYTIWQNDMSTDWTRYGAPNNIRNTTFVASGPGEGSGRVIQYTPVRTQLFTLGSGNSLTSTIVFNDFTAAMESPKDAAGNITQGNDRLFIVKVYDSAVTGSGNPDPEFDQLAHAVLLAADVDNSDTKAPAISAAAFGRKYATPIGQDPGNDGAKIGADLSAYAENIVTTGSGTVVSPLAKHGYVQYAAHSTPGTAANISGKVIFMGKASDNQRISHITAQIAGYNGGSGAGAEFRIAEWGSGEIKPLANRTLSNVQNGTSDWGFEASEQYLTLDYGHALNWKFAWDSSRHSAVTASGVNVTFRVYDFTPANNGKAGTDSQVMVNIVPYISELVTTLSSAYNAIPSAFNRSATGGYPVREGETITIKGFNFGTNPTVTVGGTTVTGTAVTNGNTISAPIGQAINSGILVVRVGGVDSFNNSAGRNANVEYNMERNGLNNNNLDNSRYLYVWNTGYLLNERVVQGPFMRMDTNANRYLSYGYYGTQGIFRIMKNNTNVQQSATNQFVENGTNRYRNTTIAFDEAGDWYAGATNMTAGNNYNFTFFERIAASGANNATGNNKRRLEQIYNPATGVNDADRVKIPRIFARNTNGAATGTNNNPTRIFMSYYDGNSTDNAVVFRYGNVGANNAFGGNLSSVTMSNTTGSYPDRQVVADNSTGYQGGVYTAVGGLSNGRPVIAWYDRVNQKLLFSFGSGTPSAPGGNNYYSSAGAIVTTTTAQWQANAAEIATFKGTHVDMAVDGNDNVHIAYYDVANGGLYYTYIPLGTGTPTKAGIESSLQTVRVDTYLSAGAKLMINVRKEGANYVPYISYYHGSFTETKNAIRVAWRKDFSGGTVPHGTNPDDSFTGAWEVMTVPVGTIPLAEEFICNGVPAATTGWAAPAGSTLRTYNNLNRSILLGYMTADWYEGAILKDSLYQ